MAEKEKDPCWKNYKQTGMNNKDGKKVPNCVPKQSRVKKTAKFLLGHVDLTCRIVT